MYLFKNLFSCQFENVQRHGIGETNDIFNGCSKCFSTHFSGLCLRRETFGRTSGRTSGRTVVSGDRVVSGAQKKAFDRGGPVWPPRPNAVDDRLRGGLGGLCSPSQKNGWSGEQRPPAKTDYFLKAKKIEKYQNRKVLRTLLNAV